MAGTSTTEKGSYWNLQVETMPRKRLAKLQLERLRKTVRRTYEKIPFYREAMDRAGFGPDDLSSLDDLVRLPTTTKDDLRLGYPLGFLTCSQEEIVRFHASSGTTGVPVIAAYTRKDMELWGDVMARCLVAAGVQPGMFVHNAYGYGLFTGGLGFQAGIQRLGAAEVPMSGGMTQRQVSFLADLGSQVLTCTPSYALVIAETARGLGVDLAADPRLQIGIFGAEVWTDSIRQQVEAALGLRAYNIYGLTEIIGPGVAAECPAHRGLHIQEDWFLPEILDPDTGESLPPGEQGELCLTTLKEAMPLLRFRTKDLTRLDPDPCPCGRTTVRMDPVLGRSDDMLTIRGVNVFPSEIEIILLRHGEFSPNYQVVVDREHLMDTLEVRVEVTPAVWEAGSSVLDSLEALLRQELLELLAVSAKVQLVAPGWMPRSEGKAKRIVDRRDLDAKKHGSR